MKRNTRWYLSAAAAGALLAGAALWAVRTFPAAPAAVPGFFGLAGGLLFFCAMAELLSTRDLDPARRERDREDHDERGAMIRAMARARAGDVLLWLLLFGAAYLYFFGVPKWINITLLGLACVKLLLDWMFTVGYLRQYSRRDSVGTAHNKSACSRDFWPWASSCWSCPCCWTAGCPIPWAGCSAA